MKTKYNFRDKIAIFDMRYGLGKLEYLLSINWLNVFLTIYLNLRSFPLKQAIKFPIFVYGFPRIYGLSGRMIITGIKVSTGMIKLNHIMTGAPNCTSINSEIFNEGTISFNGGGEIGTGTKIRVAFGAILEIGKNFKVTDMCNIGCLHSITIGDDTWIVHRSQVCDSNYHFVENLHTHKIPSITSKIVIGRRCWICNSCSITGGTVIPDNTIVASNSLVSKDYSEIPPFSIIGGIPATLISKGHRWVKKGPLEKEVINFYIKNPNGCFENSHPMDFDLN